MRTPTNPPTAAPTVRAKLDDEDSLEAGVIARGTVVVLDVKFLLVVVCGRRVVVVVVVPGVSVVGVVELVVVGTVVEVREDVVVVVVATVASSRTDTLLTLVLHVAISVLLSPLKSPTATPLGYVPTL